ncbi:MAG TPA: hypothetical protein VD886_15645 [Herpetosiphonaceae bacterium]|nr:hypothetical protein [Herpetosiphonaceae bacterium]
MQLGEWVEFQMVVGKQATGAGSVPVCQPLRRARKGMIVGMRNVYDVTAGSPPQLDNPRPVLIVAVSLHRSYRVYPQDATVVAAPSPSRRTAGTQRVPAAASLSHPGGSRAAGRLGSVDDDDLAVMVADQINTWIGQGEMFTAYDVTMALRMANGQLKISHTEVRPLVHSQMEAAVVSGIYQRESASFGTDTATRYLPT